MSHAKVFGDEAVLRQHPAVSDVAVIGGAIYSREQSRGLEARGRLSDHRSAFRDAQLFLDDRNRSWPRLEEGLAKLRGVLSRYGVLDDPKAPETWINSPAVRYLPDADRAGLTKDLINRVDEQLAAQSLARARSHDRRGDAPAARLVLRRLVQRYPGTAAARDAQEILKRRGWDQEPAAAPPAPEAARKPRRRPNPGRRRRSFARLRRRGVPWALIGMLAVLGACSADPSKGYSFRATYAERGASA